MATAKRRGGWLSCCVAIATAFLAASSAAEPSSDDVAGWDPVEGGFILRSPDGAYSFRPGLQSGYRFEPTWLNGESQPQPQFFVVRPYATGSLYRKWIRYSAVAEFNASPPYLLDYVVDARPVEAIGIQVGQQLTPFSRQEWRAPPQLLFPEWDIVADYFATGRNKGALVYGNVGEGRFEYWAGAYIGSPVRQFLNFPGNYLYEFRTTFSPLGPVGPTEMPFALNPNVPFRYSFSLQGYVAKMQVTTSQLDPVTGLIVTMPTDDRPRLLAGGIDFGLQWDRLSFFSEAYVRRTRPGDGSESFVSVGAWAQLGYIVYGRTVALGARWSWLDPSSHLGHDQFNRIEGLIAWLVDPTHLHLQLRYGIAHQEAPTGDLDSVPLIAPTGTSQTLTLQAGVFF
ncbi:hypothetical protein [Vulgatibacter incomptus]|uniref:Phosphate-selective porin O and P n=1 Tax=Vulgatibacter incomptus TaxID=1391653 RepID=A0A0K1PEM7_9BACT|nr:hypothetical protein [Vulgatibacter incomptus]AKU91988.1 hypothetical protein AKJ08_2375 [Vulgatibacter incomptus]